MTFQASVGKNVVPVDILVKCPKLIDAETGEEVLEYLSSFGNINTEGYQEQDINNDKDIDEDIVG